MLCNPELLGPLIGQSTAVAEALVSVNFISEVLKLNATIERLRKATSWVGLPAGPKVRSGTLLL